MLITPASSSTNCLRVPAQDSSAGPPLLDLLRIGDWQARGFALGTASHGIGIARALEDNSLAGAFAGLALGLNAIVTAVLRSLVWHLFV